MATSSFSEDPTDYFNFFSDDTFNLFGDLNVQFDLQDILFPEIDPQLSTFPVTK